MQDYEQYLLELAFEYLTRHIKDPDGVKEVLMTVPLIGPGGIRQELGKISPEFFGLAYFPWIYENEVPDFHHDIYDEMCDIEEKGGGTRYVEAAPRGSAKSTRWSFIFPLHCALYGLKHFIILLGDSSTQAEGNLSHIKEVIEDNQYIIEDWGNLQGPTWRNDAILLNKVDVMIVAKGSGKAIRGIKHRHYRPDLIILDDVENDNNVLSEEQRKKLLDWYDKAVAKAGDKRTDLIIVGTVLHYSSMLSTLLERPGYKSRRYKGVLSETKNPGLWKEWEGLYTMLDDKNRAETARFFYEQNKEAMLEGVQVLWPERVSYYDYRKMIIDEGMASFNSEVQNDPINEADCPINEKEFTFYGTKECPAPNPAKCVIKGAIDPSMGKTVKSDNSAICVVAQDEAGYLYILLSDGQRRHPDKIITDIISYAGNYQFSEFACEVVQFQELFAHNLRQETAKQGIYLNVVEVRPTVDKILRITGIIPMIKNGYIRFHPSQKNLIKELCFLGKWRTDDEADALQMAVSLFTKINTEFKPRALPAICGVQCNW